MHKNKKYVQLLFKTETFSKSFTTFAVRKMKNYFNFHD